MLRVAEILGVEQSTLESAFATARAEQVDARYTSYTGLLVASETLTQVQADEAGTWFSRPPGGSDQLTERLARIAPSDQSTVQLTRLVTAGRLTQEQAEAIAAWHAERPDFLPEAAFKDSGRRNEHRGEHGATQGEHRSGHDGSPR